MFGLGTLELIILFIIFAPFIINIRLANSRGKDAALMFLLTFFFSWIVTLILAFLPEKRKLAMEAGANNPDGNQGYWFENKERSAETKICPFCSKSMNADASICGYCKKG